MARIVQPQLAPLPEPEALPSPVPSLPTLPDSTAEALPPLPPLGSSALPPIPEPILATEGTSLPKPASLSPTGQSATGTEHVVVAGDNFWTIGRKYGVSAQKIEKSNPNVIPTRLKIGQKIIIPTAAPAAQLSRRCEPSTSSTWSRTRSSTGSSSRPRGASRRAPGPRRRSNDSRWGRWVCCRGRCCRQS